MTPRTNARIAGITFLLYIAIAFPSMVLLSRATKGNGVAAKLASIAAHADDVRTVAILTLGSCFAAIVLAAALWAITRDEDRDLALIALACRTGEGFLSAIGVLGTLVLLWLATTAPAPAGSEALGGALLKFLDWNVTVAATLFAAGSTIFSWLFLRGRLIPRPLAWLGLAASTLVLVVLPAQLAGTAPGVIVELMWYPMLAFEVILGVWLIAKGTSRTSTT